MTVPMIIKPIITPTATPVITKQNPAGLNFAKMNRLIDLVLKSDSFFPEQSDINFLFSIDIDTLNSTLRYKLMDVRVAIDSKVALKLARESEPGLSDSQVIQFQRNQLEIFEQSHRASNALNSVASSNGVTPSSDISIPPCPSSVSTSESSMPFASQSKPSHEYELNSYLDLLHSMEFNQSEHSKDALQTIETLKTNISRLLGFKPTVRSSDNVNYSSNIRSLIEPDGFSRVETLGDGNCFLNSFTLLLLDFGTNNLDRQGVILSMLNNDVAKQGDDLNLTIALFNNKDISSSKKQRLITRRLKRLLKHYVEQNFDVSQGASHEMKSRLFKLRLTYNDFRTSNEDIKRRYLHEIERDRQWLGMESMDFVMDMFGRYNLNFNDDGLANAVSVFSSNATQNDRRLSYGLSNPYGAHWTLLKRA